MPNPTVIEAGTTQVSQENPPQQPLDEYASTIDWCASLNSPDTKQNYVRDIRRFLLFVNSARSENVKLSPDDLIKMPHDELKALLFKYALHLKSVAKRTVGKPKQGEISVNSLPTMFIGIKSFLDYNEISAPYWKKLLKTLPPKVKNHLRAYLHEEIARMMSLGDVFDRASIVLFKGGGERVGAQTDLLIEDIERIPEYELGVLNVYKDSAKDNYQVPLSKEDLFYIDEMLEYRRLHGEKLTPKSLLVRDKFTPMSPRTNKPQQVGRQAIRSRMRKLAIEAGLEIEVLQPDHSFRYFFDTCLMNSDCKWEIKELMMGHNVKLDKYYYDEKNPESRKKLLIEYMKAVDSLTVMPQFKMTNTIAKLQKEVENSPKLEVLQNSLLDARMENDALKKKVEKVGEQYRKEMDDFKQQVRKDMEDIAEAQAQHWAPTRRDEKAR